MSKIRENYLGARPDRLPQETKDKAREAMKFVGALIRKKRDPDYKPDSEKEVKTETYKPSKSLLGATKYLVQPQLSQTLRDRLAARKAKKEKKDGYQASAGTIGLAGIRRSQMSTSVKKEEIINSLDDVNPILEAHVKDMMTGTVTHERDPQRGDLVRYSHNGENKNVGRVIRDHGTGHINVANLGFGKIRHRIATILKSDVSLIHEGNTKGSVKRKYLGNSRGRTATGKPAHKIEVKPILGKDKDHNKTTSD